MANFKRIIKDVGITGGIIGGGYLLTNAMSGVGGNKSNSSSNSKTTGKSNAGTGSASETGTGSDGSSGSDSSGGSSTDSTTTKKKVVEVPITNYEEAMDFANREWNKIKRNDGRTLECQVQGSSSWRTGEWCKVFLPSFDIDGYMYIIRVSQTSDGGDWTTNLSLVDYPPGWGQEELEDDSDSDDDNDGASGSDDSSKIEGVINKITKEIGKFSYSGSCNDGKCLKATKKGDCWALSDYIYTRLQQEGVGARIHQYKTGSSDRHRQVEYKKGSNWIMFPYNASGIDHDFYTTSIPSKTDIIKST